MCIHVHVCVTIIIKEEVMSQGGKRKQERRLEALGDWSDIDVIFMFVVV